MPHDSLESLLLEISESNDLFLQFLKEYLNKITIERHKCIIIFRIIIDHIKDRMFSPAHSKKFEDVYDNILSDISYLKFKVKDNVDLYYDLMENLVTYINNDSVKIENVLEIIQEMSDEKTHNEINSEVKNVLEGRKITKAVRTNNQTDARGTGVRLVEKVGGQLSNTENIMNLSMMAKKTPYDSQKRMIEDLIRKYNTYHKSKIIDYNISLKISQFWAAIAETNKGKNVKYINQYIMYAFRLVKPDINQIEVNGTLGISEPDQVKSKSINKFFTNFFNMNKNKIFSEYEKRHENNMAGSYFNNSKLMIILRNYKPVKRTEISKKMIDEIESITSKTELLKFLKDKDISGNIFYVKYTDVPGDSPVKLTHKLAKEIITIPV